MPGAVDHKHTFVGRVDEFHHIAVDAHVATEPVGDEVWSGPIARLAEMGLVAVMEAKLKESTEQSQAAVVTSAKRQVEAARGAITTARANLTNPAIRSSQVAAVQGQILQAQADIAALQADAERARAQLEEARANRSDLTVIAPFVGTVATRTAEPGEVVMAGTPIVTLVNLGQVYLRAFVPEGSHNGYDSGAFHHSGKRHEHVDDWPRLEVCTPVTDHHRGSVNVPLLDGQSLAAAGRER